ncbi:glycerol dehydrogenase [Aquincola tertiaricarbonis]|uniref:glycerol dehydrogenase n=1 Tax=Aquincola tertiaricarbonis TaxID=391953 RepID=UPI000614D47B|nr:glycerol dehydrogenase [Aquincola tertiaricarbonis]
MTLQRLPEGIRSFGAAHRYYQGPGALAIAGDVVRSLGTEALLVCDGVVQAMLQPALGQACEAAGVRLRTVIAEGEVTHPTVDGCVAQARAAGLPPHVVIAAGGGKGVDTGKAVARLLGTPLVVIATAASNDGPCSKNFVYYDDAHRMLSVEHLPRNPDAVIVDTRLLVKAPRVLLLSGIGDALAKLYEGDQCRRSGARNSFGGVSTLAAAEIAKACDRVIRADALAALAAAERGEPDAAFERLTEALVLLSGLAFENSGLSLAHAMTRGLPLAAGVGRALHGLQVAYALLVQWVLEERAEAFVHEQLAFYRALGLPTHLQALGAGAVDEALLQRIAAGTMTAPHVPNFQRPLAAPDFVAAMRTLERLAAA